MRSCVRSRGPITADAAVAFSNTRCVVSTVVCSLVGRDKFASLVRVAIDVTSDRTDFSFDGVNAIALLYERERVQRTPVHENRLFERKAVASSVTVGSRSARGA